MILHHCLKTTDSRSIANIVNLFLASSRENHMFAILRGANGRRHEVDLKDDPVIVDVSTASVQIATRRYVTVGRPAHGQAPRGECVSNIVSYTAHQPSKHSLLTEFVAATVEGPFFDPAR
jgi:hypothetical protein